MNADIKKKWVEALRSGKYEQGREFLRSGDDKFCCLGVLCDIVDRDGWRLSRDGYNSYTFYYSDGDFSNMTLVSSARRDWDIYSEEHDTLTKMNDCDNKSFSEIADWIDANL